MAGEPLRRHTAEAVLRDLGPRRPVISAPDADHLSQGPIRHADRCAKPA
jgi:hypothetical protein